MFRVKPLGNLIDKNVEGAEAGTKATEVDMTKMIAILQQGKYSLVKHTSCFLIVNPQLRRRILFLISFLLGITLVHQEKFV
jgi:hypothetical protein